MRRVPPVVAALVGVVPMRPWKPLRPTSLDAGLPSPVRRARRPVRVVAVLAVAVVVIASQFPDAEPEVVGVHGRVGDAPSTTTTVIPAGARTLDPAQARPGLIATTSTTSTRPSTTRVAPSEDGPLIVVDGQRAYVLERTPLVLQFLWLATHFGPGE